MSSRVAASIGATDDLAPEGAKQYLRAVSPSMYAIEHVIADIAPTDISVLLVGESGTGKDAVAFQIHLLSPRCQKPFRKLSCSSVSPEALFPETENGVSRRSGGQGGTLYLDEVSDLSSAAQAQLLQALSEGERSSGEGVNERLICATNRNLEEQMRAGRFREELYFRINGVCLRLPPLRHRQEDLTGLADFFLGKYATLFERPQPALSRPALGRLQQHQWPGNIRELENSMKKLVVLGDEGMAVTDLGRLPQEIPAPSNGTSGISLKEAARAASRQAERELILKVLGRTRWNRKRAALELKISYKALLYKLKQIGLDDLAGS